jgi:hypothetical protein
MINITIRQTIYCPYPYSIREFFLRKKIICICIRSIRSYPIRFHSYQPGRGGLGERDRREGTRSRRGVAEALAVGGRAAPPDRWRITRDGASVAHTHTQKWEVDEELQLVPTLTDDDTWRGATRGSGSGGATRACSALTSSAWVPTPPPRITNFHNCGALLHHRGRALWPTLRGDG